MYVQYNKFALYYVQDNKFAILYVQGTILYVQDNKFDILYVPGTILYVQDFFSVDFLNACRFQSLVWASSLELKNTLVAFH